jgi:cytochrome bd-type quinol oxidase subunit 2
VEPIAVVTALLAVLILAVRGPLVIAPTATLNVYRRWISTPGRIRLMAGVLALLAVPLIVTGRPARVEHGGIAMGIEGLGWFMAAVAAWLLATPRLYQRLAYTIFDAISDPAALRAMGVFAVAIGLGLGWLAFFVV